MPYDSSKHGRYGPRKQRTRGTEIPPPAAIAARIAALREAAMAELADPQRQDRSEDPFLMCLARSDTDEIIAKILRDRARRSGVERAGRGNERLERAPRDDDDDD